MSSTKSCQQTQGQVHKLTNEQQHEQSATASISDANPETKWQQYRKQPPVHEPTTKPPHEHVPAPARSPAVSGRGSATAKPPHEHVPTPARSPAVSGRGSATSEQQHKQSAAESISDANPETKWQQYRKQPPVHEPTTKSPHEHVPTPARSPAVSGRGSTTSEQQHKRSAAEPISDANPEAEWQQYRKQMTSRMLYEVKKMGYPPPSPPPLLTARALDIVVRDDASHRTDPGFSAALPFLKKAITAYNEPSYIYLEQLRDSLARTPLIDRLISQLSPRTSINRATISIEMPDVAPSLQQKMDDIEHFLAKDWVKETGRGVLAIHVDEAKGATIIQIGVAKHGTIYITVPQVLRPENIAEASIQKLLGRLTPFQDVVDPMAVINGAHQGLVYNKIFRNTRVIRAPSGDTSRLASNIKECAQRERLSVDNTAILNSAPKSAEECRRVFRGRDVWHAWRNEAVLWNNTVQSANFAASQVQEASREAVLLALAREKNVIVIVAHCEDGQRIYMPDPAPQGSVVTRDDLLANREQIAANAPFVYLFSCEAGELSNLQNIASTLLECGAAGVVASQAGVDGIGERPLLQRLLDDGREAPPIEDFFVAIHEVNYLNMEVYLA